MESVDINEAKSRLSQLVAKAAKGEEFIISTAGKPVVRGAAIAIDSAGAGQQKRLGFLEGQFKVPDDFDRMGQG